MDDTTHQPTVRLQGFHAVKHAVRFGAGVERVLVTDRNAALELAGELAPDLEAALRDASVVSAGEFEESLGSLHPTGVGAVAARPPLPDLEALLGRAATPVVFLEEPRHLGNIGAVIRAVAGLGGSGVLTSGPADPWHETALRGSAGLHFAIPVLRVEALPAFDNPLIALDPEGRDVNESAIPANAVLAFGTERSGLSDQVLARAAHRVRIPMRDGVSSLNLATSVAVALFASLS